MGLEQRGRVLLCPVRSAPKLAVFSSSPPLVTSCFVRSFRRPRFWATQHQLTLLMPANTRLGLVSYCSCKVEHAQSQCFSSINVTHFYFLELVPKPSDPPQECSSYRVWTSKLPPRLTFCLFFPFPPYSAIDSKAKLDKGQEVLYKDADCKGGRDLYR